MPILYALGRMVAIAAGAAIVLGLTEFLILSQDMGDAHALKARVIAGGIIAGGMLLSLTSGKGRALVVIGVIAAELFNIGMVAEQNWRERAERRAAIERSNADLNAAHDKAAAVHAAAAERLEKAEAAKARADAIVADNNKTRDCKRDCMAGNLAQADKAADEVTAARTALAAAPLPAPPVLVDTEAGATGWQWDLAMGIIGSIGGNLIAIGLMNLRFGGANQHPRTARLPERTSADEKRRMPSIAAAPEPGAMVQAMAAAGRFVPQAYPTPSGWLAERESERATKSDSAQTNFPILSESSNGSNVIALFTGPQPDPNGSPNGSGPKGGRKVRRDDRKDAVLADIRQRRENGERFESQEHLRKALAERFGPIAKSSLSNWLDELPDVPRAQTGRCKAIG